MVLRFVWERVRVFEALKDRGVEVKIEF